MEPTDNKIQKPVKEVTGNDVLYPIDINTVIPPITDSLYRLLGIIGRRNIKDIGKYPSENC